MKICEFNSGKNYFNDFIIKYLTSHKKDPICLSNMNVTNVKLFDRCDFIRDCPDNTDERDCECKPPLRFQCGNGYCVDASKKCDGTTDCSDGTDGEGKKAMLKDQCCT